MSSCTTNQSCYQGYCCEVNSSRVAYQTCTWVPRDCYTGDGTRDEYESCTSNNQCATNCCHSIFNYCWGTTQTSSCMDSSSPRQGDSSCTTNESCTQGYCCEINSGRSDYLSCTWIPLDCYTGDGTRDEYEYCSENSQCATGCCHDDWDYCWGTTNTSQCKSDGSNLSGFVVALIVIGVLAAIAVIVVSICCCVYKANRKNLKTHQVTQSNASVISKSRPQMGTTIAPLESTCMNPQPHNQGSYPKQGGQTHHPTQFYVYYPQQAYHPQPQYYPQHQVQYQGEPLAPPEVFVPDPAEQQAPPQPEQSSAELPVAEPIDDSPVQPRQQAAEPGSD